jgi:O-antigen/teichoic acid export membrane protein
MSLETLFVRLRAATPLGRLLALTTGARPAVIVSLGSRGLEAAAKFALYALAARALGGHDAGRFFLALGVIQIVSTVARLGLEKPVTRHVAAELAVGDVAAARRASMTAGGSILAASVLAGLVLAGAGPVIADHWTGQADMAPALMLAALIIPVQNLAFAVAYVLIGLERGAAGQMVMNALPPVLSLIALCLGADSLDGLLIAYAGSFGACALLGLGLVVTTRWSQRHPQVSPSGALGGLWRGARRLMVVDVCQAALITIPVLILGAFAAPDAVSTFSLCNRLAMLVTIVVLSLGAMSAPRFARHHRLGDWTALRAAAIENRRATVALCLPLIAALAFGSGPLLDLLSVPAAQGVPVLLILLTGQLAYSLLPSRDLLLAMAGEERVLRRLSLWQLVFCVALCLALTPPFGAVGAALASASIWIGGALAVAVAARRRLPELGL